MSPENRAIFYSLCAADGTMINWRRMQIVINQVANLDYLVLFHRAGVYDEGELVVGVLHTLNWTNSENYNKHVVINKNIISYVQSTM